MKREVIIDSICGLTRLFVFEDDELCEAYFLKDDASTIVGSVYLGNVVNISKALNAAFVDIGLEKNGFLNLDDAPEQYSGVRAGERIIVQVERPPIGEKGAKLNGRIKLSGEYVVLMPHDKCVRISSSIKNTTSRDRLKAVGTELLEKSGCGVILRTEAEKTVDDDIKKEFTALCSEYEDVAQRAQALRPPAKLLGARSAYDMIRSMISGADEVTTDSERIYEELAGKHRVAMHKGEIPLVDLYRGDTLFESMIRRKVHLPSGGNIVIEKTEAMTVIDVNSAENARGSKGSTVLSTNLEAAQTIMRLLRLRNISGIIAVDFIDMESGNDKSAHEDRLRELAKSDRSRPTVYPITEPGVILITRKRQATSAYDVYSEFSEVERAYYAAATEIRRKRALSSSNPILIRADKRLCELIKSRGFVGFDDIHCVEDNSIKCCSFSVSITTRADLPADAVEINRGLHETD